MLEIIGHTRRFWTSSKRRSASVLRTELPASAGELRPLPDAIASLLSLWDIRSLILSRSSSFVAASDLTLDFFFFLLDCLVSIYSSRLDNLLLYNTTLGHPSFELEGATRAEVVIRHGGEEPKTDS